MKGFNTMNKIKELRQAKGMTQSELANKMEVSTSCIGMYEQERRDPDIGMWVRLAEEFDVSLDYLTGKSQNIENFDTTNMANDITEELMNKEALMFSADYYSDVELFQLQEVIKDTVNNALIQILKK